MTSRHIYQRLKGHIDHCKYRMHLPIYNAIKKYGMENIQIELLYESNNFNIINKKEKFFIKKFNSLSPKGYNIQKGGYKPPLKKRNGFKPIKQTKIKISKTLKLYYKENGTEICKKAQKIAANNRAKKAISLINKEINKMKKDNIKITQRGLAKRCNRSQCFIQNYLKTSRIRI